MDANEYGTQLIKSMVPNCDFSFPKSIYNVYECLRAVTLNRPNALILDFFAGSGTTGHATLLLNKDLGGNRRFILCTNNDIGEKKEKEFLKSHNDIIDYESTEWLDYVEKFGIASSVTYPRNKAAIEGYTHSKDTKDVLYQQKITPAIIKNNKKLLVKIDEIEAKYKSSYDEIKIAVEDDTLKILGITKKGNKVEGIPANLKYYKTEFVSKNNEFLSESLLNHISEMIQIEKGIKIDQKKYVLILDEDFADTIESNIEDIDSIRNIYISKNVMLTSKQNKLFENVDKYIIPDYYFDFELKEVGESW